MTPSAPAPAAISRDGAGRSRLTARSAACEAADLEDFGARLAAFDGCSLKATAKNLCFYRGWRRRVSC